MVTPRGTGVGDSDSCAAESKEMASAGVPSFERMDSVSYLAIHPLITEILFPLRVGSATTPVSSDVALGSVSWATVKVA